MCNYCDGLGFGEDLLSKELNNKKIMEICGESVNIALAMQSYPKDNKYRYFLAGFLESDIEVIMDKSVVEFNINYCPFCGRKFEK